MENLITEWLFLKNDFNLPKAELCNNLRREHRFILHFTKIYFGLLYVKYIYIYKYHRNNRSSYN